MPTKKRTEYEIVNKRLCGLKHFDAAVQEIGKPALLSLTRKFYKNQRVHQPGLNIGGTTRLLPWTDLNEALFDAIFHTLPNVHARLSFNLNEALTEKQIEKLAHQLKITDPYEPQRKRRDLDDHTDFFAALEKEKAKPFKAFLTTPAEFLDCPLGLYKIYWLGGGGGFSYASVGMTDSGRRWMAPVNWNSGSTSLSRRVDWIQSMELIHPLHPRTPLTVE